ncbi:MAG: hypothetical protein L0170_17350, partial [Acidobacteria bacterium]|nr:hypothetical protein [Acidobacteriota bacterium]
MPEPPPHLRNLTAARRKHVLRGSAKLTRDRREDESSLAAEIAGASSKSDGNTSRAWGSAWRRSARRWESLAARIASVTGWRVWNPGRYGERWHSLFRSIYPVREEGILIFGLNPGPYGMAQTGIPFTDIKRLEAQLPTLAGAIRRRRGQLRLPGLAPRSLHPFLSRTFESSSVRVYRFLLLGWGNAERGWREVAVAN